MLKEENKNRAIKANNAKQLEERMKKAVVVEKKKEPVAVP